jgi:hypothetical protein
MENLLTIGEFAEATRVMGGAGLEPEAACM